MLLKIFVFFLEPSLQKFPKSYDIKNSLEMLKFRDLNTLQIERINHNATELDPTIRLFEILSEIILSYRLHASELAW